MAKMVLTETQDFLVVLVIEESQEKMEYLEPQVRWEKKVPQEILDLRECQATRDPRENEETLAYLDLKDLEEDLAQLVLLDR